MCVDVWSPSHKSAVPRATENESFAIIDLSRSKSIAVADCRGRATPLADILDHDRQSRKVRRSSIDPY
jgi:hypothetical protein